MYHCKYCGKGTERAGIIESRTKNKLTVEYFCEECRGAAEKEVRGDGEPKHA
jgi:hypothetical protein